MRTRRIPISFVLITAIIALAAGPAVAGPVVWDPAAGGNAHSYELVPGKDGLTWEAARQAAEGRFWQGMAGQLAALTSPEENAWVWEALDHPAGCWLGGYQLPGATAPDEGWQWISGDLWVFANWEPGQPDGTEGGGRLRFAASTLTGGWDDACATCAGTGYIVEYAPTSTPSDQQTWGAIKGLF